MDATELKARALVLSFLRYCVEEEAKICAIICCEEIISSWSRYNGLIDKDFYPKEVEFWVSVIEKIKTL